MPNLNLPEVPPAGKKAVATIGGCATAGAILGSLVPAVGTAIGAGVGGIVGGVAVITKEAKK